MGPHILKANQFSRSHLEELFEEAIKMKKVASRGGDDILRRKIVATLFYEPSTRTRLSFESAALRLGARVISTENAREFSSAIKGESIEDTIRVVEGYADAIILRHHEEGAAQRAATVSSVPIINAGDGSGEHPTQALLDLFTIQIEVGKIDGVKIAFMGDLANGRTARSLAMILSKFKNPELFFVAPKELQMRDDVKNFLRKNNIAFEETSSLAEIIQGIDVIYQTRLQKERLGKDAEDMSKAYKKFVVDNRVMEINKNVIILHPLPRNDEITTEVDSNPRAAYFRQAHNGLFIRMALLKMLLSP